MYVTFCQLAAAALRVRVQTSFINHRLKLWSGWHTLAQQYIKNLSVNATLMKHILCYCSIYLRVFCQGKSTRGVAATGATGSSRDCRDVFQKQSLTTWDCVWGRLDDGFYIFLQSPSYTFPLVHCYAISNLVTFLCKAKLREKLYRFLSPSLYVTFCQLAVAAHSDILQKSWT